MQEMEWVMSFEDGDSWSERIAKAEDPARRFTGPTWSAMNGAAVVIWPSAERRVSVRAVARGNARRSTT